MGFVQLLLQEKNPGLKYEYIIKKPKETGNEVMEPVYVWRHGAWTDCSTTCGLGWLGNKHCSAFAGFESSLIVVSLLVVGEQHQPARCFEIDVGVVDESLCDTGLRPGDRHRKCKSMDCPARSVPSHHLVTVDISTVPLFL